MNIQQAITGMRMRLDAVARLGTVLLAVLALGAGSLHAAEGANTLESVDYTALGGNKVRIVLKMGSQAAEPTTFTTDNPARIALDFANTTSKLAERTTAVGVGVARSVTAVEAQGRTRVVINLATTTSFETKVMGNEVIVELGGAATTAQASQTSSYDPRVVRALTRAAVRPRAASAVSATSISAVARVARGGFSSSSPTPTPWSTCAKRRARSCSTSRTPPCRASWYASSTFSISRPR